uniref:Uncharacterized protein n=1 Tax=Rhizophora mucronata TaxID=61149 RepID=A0A2P2NX07_RHIMU
MSLVEPVKKSAIQSNLTDANKKPRYKLNLARVSLT